MRTNGTLPRIAVLVDTSTGWGRRLIGGVMLYSQKHGPWHLWVEAHGLHEHLRPPPGWVGEGIVARVSTPAMAAELRRTRIPVVNVSGVRVTGPQFPTVTVDLNAAGRLAARHFLDRGFRHFAYCGFLRLSYVARHYEAFRDSADVHRFELVLQLDKNNKPGPQLELSPVRATGVAPADLPDPVAHHITVPPVEDLPPAPGRRARVSLPGWESTAVRHVLTLPRDHAPHTRFPVLVEYTGNVFYHKFCHSTGYTDQGTMAYGLSKGEGFICLNLPFVSTDGRREQPNAWGDPDKTVAYCLQAINDTCERYGGDPSAVLFTGFSRGQYAANYIALRTPEIADVWLAFIAARPDLPWDEKNGKGWNNVGVGWDERAARVGGRACTLIPASLGAGVHVDVEFLEDRPSTLTYREWLRDVLKNRPGTRSVSGRVLDPAGNPVPTARVQSGPTRFTFTDAAGRYTLPALPVGPRNVTASRGGAAAQLSRTITAADTDLADIDFTLSPHP